MSGRGMTSISSTAHSLTRLKRLKLLYNLPLHMALIPHRYTIRGNLMVNGRR